MKDLHLIEYQQEYVNECLTIAYETFESNSLRDEKITLELLQFIAFLRFSSIYVAKWLIQSLVRDESEPVTEFKICYGSNIWKNNEKLGTIINAFKEIYLAEKFIYLRAFFFKIMYYKLGSDCIKLFMQVKDEELKWIVPKETVHFIKEGSAVIHDYFLILGEEYNIARNFVEKCLQAQTRDPLNNFFTDSMNLSQIQNLLFSIFHQLLVSVNSSENTPIPQELITIEHLFNEDFDTVPPDLKLILLQLTRNNLCNGLIPELHLDKNSRIEHICMARLIYHLGVLLSSEDFPNFLTPLTDIYYNPDNLNTALFPTMPNNLLLEARESIKETGTWYECHKGHPFFIGQYENPNIKRNCPECGVIMGEKMRRLHDGNQLPTRTTDSTQAGHILGDPKKRSGIPTGERGLSPASVLILRAFMHTIFIWSACTKHKDDPEPIMELISKGLTDSMSIPAYFYQHLMQDIRDIAKITGQNFEHSSLILHVLFIKAFRNLETVMSGLQLNVKLTSRNIRDKWEKEIDRILINPILSDITNILKDSLDLVIHDPRIVNSPLLRLIYEKEDWNSNDPYPYLWRYRTIVTLEHFTQSFNSHGTEFTQKYPILTKFLNEETLLSATAYLPDIIRLQRKMSEIYFGRLDLRSALKKKIKDFLKEIEDGDPRESEEYNQLLINFMKTWNKIGHYIVKNSRLAIKIAIPEIINYDTSITYLLPTYTRNGVVMTSLIDTLVMVHNSFIHKYRCLNKQYIKHFEDKINLSLLTAAHTIDYAPYIHSLIISHTHYSLAVALGQGTHLTYDFAAIEKQFTDQFIHCKPLIVAEYQRFEYNKETFDLQTIEDVKNKVEQKQIDINIWKLIVKEIDTLHNITDVFNLINVVIGFVSSAGGEKDMRIITYLHDTLKYPHGTSLISRKAENYCTMKHLISLWKFLSIEKAKKLSGLDHIPFTSLPKVFYETLIPSEIQLLQQKCQLFDLDKSLLDMHDFILFFVNNATDEMSNYPLSNTLQLYKEEKTDNPAMPPGFMEHFPKEFLMSKICYIWAEMARAQLLIHQ